ncbi:hypothetical protein AXG93_328s1010 [Marchantia polymorpha subsp. ruderalis]|uniref:Uncharacterized protein n=1 Tax=Marchantia polymorpha subsp. ruderalis TaxID=1480154 RepID=A0A176VP06_MARPO|nr:hypothetical protein AXG93_328s1010 [Marchantia polymorpha subsp. ruderalis]
MIELVRIRLHPKIFGSSCLWRSLFWTYEELRLRRRHRNQFQIAQRAGRRSHAFGVLLGAGGVIVRALKVKAVRGDFAPTLRYRARTSEREREEEKRFPRERKILTTQSSEGTKDENRPPSIPTNMTAKGPVQVDVVQRRKKPERRLTKRRKVTRSARGEETPQLKMNEDLEKESTLSEEILEQVVARIGGTVVEAEGITLPTSPVEELGKAEMRSEESQRRMEKAEEAYRQLREESTDELKLRLEKCLNGFAMWGLDSHIGKAFGGSVDYLSPFFINFYKGIDLLIAAKQKRFPLEIETVNDKQTLGGNEVVSEEDDTALALPLTKANK